LINIYRQPQQILFAPSAHATCSARLIKFVVFDCVRLSVFKLLYHNGMSSTKKKIIDWIFVIVDWVCSYISCKNLCVDL